MSERSNDALEEARRYVRRKRIFYTVLGIWLALSLMWFLIDMRDDSSSSGSTGPCSARASPWPLPGSCSWGSAGSSAPTGSAGRSTSISAAEGTSQVPSCRHSYTDADRAPPPGREPMKRAARASVAPGCGRRRGSARCCGVRRVRLGVVSTDESTIARAMIWRESDVGDQHRFPARRIPAGADASPLRAGAAVGLVVGGEGEGLDQLLRDTDTLAFLVAHDDRLVYERYFEGATRESLQTSFSVAKSFVSTLVGIAIDEGLIGGVDDPVTEYLPELASRDPGFRQITLRDLLTMSSGIRYREGGFPWPFGDDIYTYYGVDLRDVALNRVRIDGPPGGWQYNNYHPLLLGLVLERVTGTSVSDYMATEALAAAGSRSRCHLEPRLRALRVREAGERPQREAGRLRPLRPALPPRR